MKSLKVGECERFRALSEQQRHELIESWSYSEIVALEEAFIEAKRKVRERAAIARDVGNGMTYAAAADKYGIAPDSSDATRRTVAQTYLRPIFARM